MPPLDLTREETGEPSRSRSAIRSSHHRRPRRGRLRRPWPRVIRHPRKRLRRSLRGVSERRRRKEPTPADRRGADRRARSGIDEQLRTIGWSLVLLDLAKAKRR